MLWYLDTPKLVVVGGVHQRVLRHLWGELAKPLFIIYHGFWLTGEVTDNWGLASMTTERVGSRIQGTTGLST